MLLPTVRDITSGITWMQTFQNFSVSSFQHIWLQALFWKPKKKQLSSCLKNYKHPPLSSSFPPHQSIHDHLSEFPLRSVHSVCSIRWTKMFVSTLVWQCVFLFFKWERELATHLQYFLFTETDKAARQTRSSKDIKEMTFFVPIFAEGKKWLQGAVDYSLYWHLHSDLTI